MNLGVYLKNKRIDKGLSQGDLAKKLGYTTSQYISNWECGRNLPPVNKSKKLCKLLGVPYSEYKKEYTKLLFS